MANQKTFGEAVQAYLRGGPATDSRRPGKGSFRPTQEQLARECDMAPRTLSVKLTGAAPLTDYDIRAIGSTLIYWGYIKRRSQLHQLLGHIDYQLSDDDWRNEPWQSLPDDTIPQKQPELLLILNPSFDDWGNGEPSQWLCNTKTGWVKPVPGRGAEESKTLEIKIKGSKALEVGGNPDNREWVYCRTRETQVIPVVPGSKVKLSFWGRKVQEGKNPERSKYVEVFFHDGSGWVWGFGQEVTNSGNWAQYETEWWNVPATAQKVSVGIVVFKDGAFQIDDIELHMRTDT